MIDSFALGVSHGLLLLTAWLLMRRPDLDREGAARPSRFARRRDGAPPRA
jgi:hypothetical protein